MTYSAADFLRMAWRNLDGAIRCLANGEIDTDAGQVMIDRLNRIQDAISKSISDIHEAQEV